MSEITVGDWVKYRAGRGYSKGRVANLAEGMATIATKDGKLVYRLLRSCKLVQCGNEPASEEPASEPTPTCSADAI